MNLVVRKFEELNSAELYEILKARAAIFVVEQNCAYQDMDDLDYQSIHMFYQDGRMVTAYLRAFYKEEDVVKIGRVLTLHHGTGLGGRLLHEALMQIRKEMPCRKIYIEAQCHAIGFYEREGFRVTSGEFLEDGIPHVKMELELTEPETETNGPEPD